MRKNKKGFTLVELAIVITVIAILAAVLIPTYGAFVQRSKESAKMQSVESARDEFFTGSGLFETLNDMEGVIFVLDGETFVVRNRKMVAESVDISNLENITGNYISNEGITVYVPEGFVFNQSTNNNNNNNNNDNNNNDDPVYGGYTIYINNSEYDTVTYEAGSVAVFSLNEDNGHVTWLWIDEWSYTTNSGYEITNIEIDGSSIFDSIYYDYYDRTVNNQYENLYITIGEIDNGDTEYQFYNDYTGNYYTGTRISYYEEDYVVHILVDGSEVDSIGYDPDTSDFDGVAIVVNSNYNWPDQYQDYYPDSDATIYIEIHERLSELRVYAVIDDSENDIYYGSEIDYLDYTITLTYANDEIVTIEVNGNSYNIPENYRVTDILLDGNSILNDFENNQYSSDVSGDCSIEITIVLEEESYTTSVSVITRLNNDDSTRTEIYYNEENNNELQYTITLTRDNDEIVSIDVNNATYSVPTDYSVTDIKLDGDSMITYFANDVYSNTIDNCSIEILIELEEIVEPDPVYTFTITDSITMNESQYSGSYVSYSIDGSIINLYIDGNYVTQVEYDPHDFEYQGVAYTYDNEGFNTFNANSAYYPDNDVTIMVDFRERIYDTYVHLNFVTNYETENEDTDEVYYLDAEYEDIDYTISLTMSNDKIIRVALNGEGFDIPEGYAVSDILLNTTSIKNSFEENSYSNTIQRENEVTIKIILEFVGYTVNILPGEAAIYLNYEDEDERVGASTTYTGHTNIRVEDYTPQDAQFGTILYIDYGTENQIAIYLIYDQAEFDQELEINGEPWAYNTTTPLTGNVTVNLAYYFTGE